MIAGELDLEFKDSLSIRMDCYPDTSIDTINNYILNNILISMKLKSMSKLLIRLESQIWKKMRIQEVLSITKTGLSQVLEKEVRLVAALRLFLNYHALVLEIRAAPKI
mmetsp:Transcript_18334/g.28077  ORF Transcript_18334/g.28077 Transcript_18334/m.28077 type:complete len:108 (+) Transcript_18334:143-466(+)